MQILLVFLLIINASLAQQIKLLSENFYPAGLNILQLEDPKNTEIEINTGKKTYRFTASGKKAFYAIPYDAGRVAILNVIKNGKIIYRKFIKIHQKKYPVSRITVKERKKTKELLKRIQDEYRLIRKVLSIKTTPLFTEDRFIPPLKKLVVSTPFGAKRIINGKKRSIHWGTDFSAPEGTPVYATLTGRVVLARELFYTGKTVIINHGGGLFSLYAHLSQINVKEGQTVKGGQVIGKVGSTGRSTGPHLHFGIYLNGLRVDPSLALKLKL
ncbi:M23 family metallopeptidase [Persephonella sp.]